MCLKLSKKGGKKNKTDFDIRVPQEGVEPSRPKTLVLSQVTIPFVYQGKSSAGGGIRTLTTFLSWDFKSHAAAITPHPQGFFSITMPLFVNRHHGKKE